MNRSFVVAGVFVLGCATGGAAARYVSVANAQPPAGTPMWVYGCFKDDDPERIQQRATDLGGQGWELTSAALSGGADMSSPIWCFKRPR